MRWHYVSGVVFGVFTLTFAFSGLVSMEPWAWTNAEGLELPRDVLSGGPVDLSQFTAHDAAEWDHVLGGRPAKEIEFARMLDEPYYIVRRGSVARDEADRERLHQPYPIRHARIEDRSPARVGDDVQVRPGLFDQAALVARIKAAAPDARDRRDAAADRIRLVLLLAHRADSAPGAAASSSTTRRRRGSTSIPRSARS